MLTVPMRCFFYYPPLPLGAAVSNGSSEQEIPSTNQGLGRPSAQEYLTVQKSKAVQVIAEGWL